MREILFRGKQKGMMNGVEGTGIFTDGINAWISANEPNRPIAYGLKHKIVLPETVGQFTGLTDKNGKKIFEGDVVKAVIIRDLGGGTENREETGIIGYDKIGMIGLIAKYVGTIPVWSDFFQELTLSGCIGDFWFEVIGNIHDNPELLENP